METVFLASMPSSGESGRHLGEAVEAILGSMDARGSLLVAFSGGVDSALVAHLAREALGDDAVAVTAASESMAGHELERAKSAATEIGIRHRVVSYSDLDDPSYVANTGLRCFHCRQGMARRLLAVAAEEGVCHLADGVITDDRGDYRPGIVAMEEAGFWHPLEEAGLGKDDVRALARERALSAHDEPPNACLSSRIARGTPVTVELLRRVESGEDLLRSMGFRQVRVRAVDEGARVEVGGWEVPRLVSPRMAPRVTAALERLGFSHVELDPQGYRTRRPQSASRA